jgi:hypothetical protein
LLIGSSISELVKPVQFPRNFVDALLQIASRTLIGIHRGAPSTARFSENGDTQFWFGDTFANHARKLNGGFGIRGALLLRPSVPIGL